MATCGKYRCKNPKIKVFKEIYSIKRPLAANAGAKILKSKLLKKYTRIKQPLATNASAKILKLKFLKNIQTLDGHLRQ